jgi:AcrR family transcriptional regulator
MGTREEILSAANAAYVQHGYEGLSLRAVAKEVGVTPMAIYRHFKDKDDLMHHVVLHGLSLWKESLDAIPAQKDPWKRIEKVGHAYVRFSIEHRAYFEVVFLSTDQVGHLKHRTEEGARMFDELFTTYASWVARCLPEGMGRNEARETAIDIWAYSHGLVALELAGRLAFLKVSFVDYHAKKLRAFLTEKRAQIGART